MKTNNASLITKTLLVLGVFGITTFITYGAVSTSGGVFKSTPYQSRNTTADATLSKLTDGKGGAILDGVVAKVKAKAIEKGGSPLNVSVYNAYIDNRLAAIDALDNQVQKELGSDYVFLFQYIYPRVLELKQTENDISSVIDRITGILDSDSSSSGNGTTANTPTISSDDKLTLKVTGGIIACGNPNKNDYTTYSNIGTVILSRKYCNEKGGDVAGKVWITCNGIKTNIKAVDSLVNGDSFSCPVPSNTTNTVGNSTSPSSTTPPASSAATLATDSNVFGIYASKTTSNTVKVDYSIPKSTGYKTCVITMGTTVEMITITSDGSSTVGNGISSGLGSSEVGFNGSRYAGNNEDLYFNLYCGKVMNAKYAQLEKVVPTTKLGKIISSPITTISVSRIPGNTDTPAIGIPSINTDKTNAKAGDTVTFSWNANASSTDYCKTYVNNVASQTEAPYLQGTSGKISVPNVVAGIYAIKIECKYNGAYIRTSPVITVAVSGSSETPLSTSCAAGGPALWGEGCSGSWNTTPNGTTATVVNTKSGYTGTYKATCNNGNWINPVATCTKNTVTNTTPIMCPASTETAVISSPNGSNRCSFTWPAVQAGRYLNMTGINNNGKLSATCTANGTWSDVVSTCPNK